MSASLSCDRAPEFGEFLPDDFFVQYEGGDIFGNDQPLEIDLGCGDGTFLTEMAKHHPERNFLGVERLLGRVRSVGKKIKSLSLENAKVLRLESLYTLEWLLKKNSVSRLHLLCPDPWPKARHHKRRLVQERFLSALQKVLATDGEFLFKTDHEDYHDWVCEEVSAFGKLTPLPWPEAGEEGSFFYPKTDFEKIWGKEGKKIYRLRLKKPKLN